MLADGLTMMFGLDRPPQPASGGFGHKQLDRVFAELSGASFGGGLYRVHTPEGAAYWTAKAEELFPELADRFYCFGYDWLGRQFALDRRRRDGPRFLVMLLEPGTGEAMEVPANITSLHTDELVQQADAALALTFYADWREASGDDSYLEAHECVGYEVPPFAGGTDEIDNLARTDMESYWDALIRLVHGGATLPAGGTVRDL